MAGFVPTNINSRNFPNNIVNKVSSRFSKMGTFYDMSMINNSIAVGEKEMSVGLSNKSNYLGDGQYNGAINLFNEIVKDVTGKTTEAYNDLSYLERRNRLRQLSIFSEIQKILNIVSNEAIYYDDKNKFCYLNVNGLRTFLKDNKDNENSISDLNEIFEYVYSLFEFDVNQSASDRMKEFLIDGALAWEIIVNESGVTKNNSAKKRYVTQFKKLDPATLTPSIIPFDDKKMEKVWVQFKGQQGQERTIKDSHIIYITYSTTDAMSPISYLEPMQRNFNLWRLIENMRVISFIMFNQFRVKMVIPTGSAPRQKWMSSVASIISAYKEDVSLNNSTGEIEVFGRPGSIPYYKNYAFPAPSQGGNIDINPMNVQGPDINNMESTNYFKNKFYDESQIPMTMLNKESPGIINVSGEGINHDEKRFNQLVTKLRSIWQEVLLKPIWVEFQYEHPEYKQDLLFKSNIGLIYNSDNYFEKRQKLAAISSTVDIITKYMEIKDGEGEQFFDNDFLIQKFSDIPTQELLENEEFKRRKKEKDKKNKKSDSNADTMFDKGSDTLDLFGTGENNSTPTESTTPTETQNTETSEFGGSTVTGMNNQPTETPTETPIETPTENVGSGSVANLNL